MLAFSSDTVLFNVKRIALISPPALWEPCDNDTECAEPEDADESCDSANCDDGGVPLLHS